MYKVLDEFWFVPNSFDQFLLSSNVNKVKPFQKPVVFLLAAQNIFGFIDSAYSILVLMSGTKEFFFSFMRPAGFSWNFFAFPLRLWRWKITKYSTTSNSNTKKIRRWLLWNKTRLGRHRNCDNWWWWSISDNILPVFQEAVSEDLGTDVHVRTLLLIKLMWNFVIGSMLRKLE